MSLAVKDLRPRHLESQFEKLRIGLVRFLSFLIGHLSDPYSSRRIPLVTELYKHLEEAARANVLAQTQKSSFAIIAIGQKNERRYLLQWNANW